MLSIKQIIFKIEPLIKGARLDKNIISYLICVVIASSVWLLNTLNKNYSTVLTYPLKYTNLPEDKYSIAELPNQLKLEVQAKGFVLLGYKLKTTFLPITLNFESYNKLLNQSGDHYEYTLHTNNLKEKFVSQIDPDIKLLNIYPENIDLKFAIAKKKKVAVRPHLSYTLKPQHMLTKQTVTPDSIWVSGPAIFIDTLQYVNTQPLTLDKLSKNERRRLDLAPSQHFHFREKEVEILLEVEQFTEVKRTFPIRVKNVPSSIKMQLFPAQVSVNYAVALSKYNQIGEQDFEFSVEYPQDARTIYLEVKATKVPNHIQNLSYSPKKIEYLLEQK